MSRVHLAGALLLILALPACGQGSRRRADAQNRQGAPVDTTIAFSRGGTISITAASGEIVVTGSARKDVRVRANNGRAKVRLDPSSGRLEVSAADGSSGDVDFELAVPLGVRIIARSQGGDVTIRSTEGDVDARTQDGEIHVHGASGHIELNALSGDIEGKDLKGGVTAQGVSSTITLMRVNGDVSAETVSGDVTLHDIVSRSVRAHSTGNDVEFDGTIDPSGRYELASHSSDVSITIPASASARITVATWSGSVNSDFPISLRPGERRPDSGRGQQFTFDLGGGAARVSLETFSGDITIHRRSR